MIKMDRKGYFAVSLVLFLLPAVSAEVYDLEHAAPRAAVNIPLAQGWNLVTLPGTGNLSIGNCSGDMYALAYVRSTGEYVPVSELGSTMGEADAKEYLRLNAFWVYAFTACVMDFGLVQPTRMSELSLDEGWNFLPVTADMAGLSISDMRGCRFESVNAWDPAGQGWRIKDANEKFAGPPTIGFAAKVHEACRLGSINESTCMQGDCSE